MASTEAPQIEIDEIDTETLVIPLIGTAPLIVHRFSEKAKRQMLDNMQGIKTPKAPKDPEGDYESAFYRTDTGDAGLPVIAFKAATVGAARFYPKSVSMVALRLATFFHADYSKVAGQKLATIHGSPHMREDVVTVGISGSDLRYRPEFTEWATSIEVTYVTSMLSRNSILSIVNAGGMGVGVGEWRVEKSGDFGTYEIDRTKEIEVRS